MNLAPNAPPLVSVVIPALNAQRFIEATLRSVLNQRYGHFEVLVVDDGSTDDTVSRVEALVRVDQRIRVIKQGRNTGVAAARNRGMREASGEYVAFLDADDLWTPWKLADQVRAMAANPDLVFVYSMLVSFGDVTLLSPYYGVKPLPFRAALNRAMLERENAVPLSSVLARLSVVRDVGGFDEAPELLPGADFDLWLRMSSGGPIGFIPRIHGFYRVHASAVTRASDNPACARYVLRKHAITASFRFTPQRGPAAQLLRSCVHLLARVFVRATEAITRGVTPARVFVQRAGLSAGIWPIRFRPKAAEEDGGS